jgi:predicted DNA-binding protein
MTTLNVDLEESLFQLLNRTASTLGKNSMDLAREVITYYLEDVEDMRLANAALRRLEKGESSTISLDELEKCLVVDR